MENSTNAAFASEYTTGLTKREYFAGLAMQGLLANESKVTFKECQSDKISVMACFIADELLKQLENGK